MTELHDENPHDPNPEPGAPRPADPAPSVPPEGQRPDKTPDDDATAAGKAADRPSRPRRRRGPNRPGELSVAAQSLLQSLNRPWLVAAWPGMGGVAAIAGGHIAQTLGATPVGMLSLAEHFPLDGVDVQHGIARTSPTPRCLLLAWKDPRGKRDLLIILGEAQPPNGGADVCRKIIDMAQARGVERVVTFAAMGSQIDPREDPRVFGATTAPTLLEAFNDASIERLGQGKVTGLNGALLAVAAERGVPAACLLGEMPIFAAGMPNPRASLEVLNAFNRFADLDVSVDLLVERAAQMQPQLESMHEQIVQLGQAGDSEAEDHEETDDRAAESLADSSSAAAPRVDEHAREHVERLFLMAAGNREEADRLKAELDRLGIFDEYEDRFLDLFRRPS